ncbi:FTR1 family protein [Oceanispirochaeta sp.]|uniref:FTR1 family iron permease n=1 Tax=Oceanispirochaeta sp. TaxID=2035350 RepID=UPI002637B199|nr:FTR1 family protein [Oceanispirochaeta sp.]MDA3956873.1 FTR1 family protein [Oceanispirochaeta sp.]
MFTGLVVSILLGAVLWLISSFIDNGSGAVAKLWESGASLVAVVFISYFIFWMIKHGSSMAGEVRKSVDDHLSGRGLFLLSTVAVAREGAEIALFAFTSDNKPVYLGGTLTGVILAALLAWLIYKSLVKLNIGLIFKITLIYLILQAAYLTGYSIHELLSAFKELGLLNSDNFLFNKVYDFKDTILDHKTGTLGILLNVSIGWYSRPEYIQFIIQILYLSGFMSFWKKYQIR